MSSLYSLGLKIYELLPDYRDCCPLCGGADCAVRLGLYYRRVVDGVGHVYEAFGVPRYLCNRRGPNRSQDVTFSVLPSLLVPRRRFSLKLLTTIVLLIGEGARTLVEVLDKLAVMDQGGHDALMVERLMLTRSRAVFSAVYARLWSFPIDGFRLEAGLKTVSSQAVEVARRLEASEPRGSPSSRVLEFHHRYFPHLLFDICLGARA